jgi:hypothetical protein
MERKLDVSRAGTEFSDADGCDLNQLLHPAQAFEHPLEVVNDPDLTLNEKRAILASWASDACALEAAPGLRQAPRGRQAVRFDDVMDALRNLDALAKEGSDSARYRRTIRKQRLSLRANRSDQGEGQSLN